MTPKEVPDDDLPGWARVLFAFSAVLVVTFFGVALWAVIKLVTHFT